MIRRYFKKNENAQTLLEYSIVVGVIAVIIFAMGPMIRRAAQGMVKTVSDQIGNQKASDQLFDDSGHLDEAYSVTRVSVDDETRDRLGTTNYIYDEAVSTTSTSLANLGFTEDPNR